MRKSYNSVLWFLLCGSFAFSYASCRSSPDSKAGLGLSGKSDQTVPLVQSNPASNRNGKIIDRIVAIVNNDAILKSDLYAKTEEVYKSQPGLPQRESDLGKRKFQELLGQVLDRIINEKLVAQQAKNPVYQPQMKPCTEEIIQGVIESKKKEYSINSDAEFIEALKSQGLNYDDYRKTLCAQFVQIQILRMAVYSRIQVSDVEIRNYYDQIIKKAGDESAEVHLFDILVPVASNAPQAAVDQAKKIADEILKTLRAGQDFETTAKAYESQGVGTSNPDLGFLSAKDLPKELKEAVALSGKNEVVGPVRAGRGFHLLKWVEKRNSDVRAFSEAKEGLRNQLAEKRGEAAVESWIKELRRKAYVDVRLDLL